MLRAFASETTGKTGYILGGFSRAEGQPDIGKFTLTLRKDGSGRWLIVSDMDNGNAAPRPPAGAIGAGKRETGAGKRSR